MRRSAASTSAAMPIILLIGIESRFSGAAVVSGTVASVGASSVESASVSASVDSAALVCSCVSGASVVASVVSTSVTGSGDHAATFASLVIGLPSPRSIERTAASFASIFSEALSLSVVLPAGAFACGFAFLS